MFIGPILKGVMSFIYLYMVKTLQFKLVPALFESTRQTIIVLYNYFNHRWSHALVEDFPNKIDLVGFFDLQGCTIAKFFCFFCYCFKISPASCQFDFMHVTNGLFASLKMCIIYCCCHRIDCIGNVLDGGLWSLAWEAGFFFQECGYPCLFFNAHGFAQKQPL